MHSLSTYFFPFLLASLNAFSKILITFPGSYEGDSEREDVYIPNFTASCVGIFSVFLLTSAAEVLSFAAR